VIRTRQLAAILSLILAMGAPASIVSARASFAETERAIYRLPAMRPEDLRPLLRLGLDIAGTGPAGEIDVILDATDLARVRGLGYEPRALSIAGRGTHGAAQSPLGKPGLGAYHTYDEARAEMAAYAAAHPTIARVESIGASVEGRAIAAVVISDNVTAEEGEPEALLVGCHHSRELMSVELPLYVMRRLLDGYGVDPVITGIVNSREIWIVPVANPDGLVYVETHDGGQSTGWWRKNRRPNPDGSIGVDLNRNYGYAWGYDDIGSSPVPSSDTYRGSGPFSEPETAALRDLIASRGMSASLSFHSYGDLVLYPWGYVPGDTPDQPVFQALADSMALQNGYLAGNPKSGAIYLTNGGMDDWVYGDAAAKPRLFGFTFELNTADEGGFDPPETLIGPTCESNWGPVLTLLRYADAPRRVLPPPRPESPRFASAPGGVSFLWSYPEPDPANPPVRHEIREIASIARATDDAESGTADWDTLRFEWSAARHASGLRSDWSGSGDQRTSVLTARAALDVVAGDSIAVSAYWDLDSNHDYWYAEASADGGKTWQTLPGTASSPLNPFGKNLGNGVTGTSGGAFVGARFSLAAFAGRQVLTRFRCITDDVVHGEGLYLDDLGPVARESGGGSVDTASPDSVYLYAPPPAWLAYVKVRAVDGEAQAGAWSARVAVATPTAVATGAPPVHDLLGPATPNPFNPQTEIRFAVAEGPYRLDVFDAAGTRVVRLAEGRDAGGQPRLARWGGLDASGRRLASGVYFVRLTTARGVLTRKIAMIR
jgi:zinc carboxypeptidase/immune inhibitor InhA-like protein